MTQVLDLLQLKEKLARFALERDWDQFHSPKNLAMAIAGEAGELLEIFQWMSEEQSATLDAGKHHATAMELADLQIYLVRLADKLDIDLNGAVSRKLSLNEQRYPADLVRGSARKYDEY